jgi:hypothetical protein
MLLGKGRQEIEKKVEKEAGGSENRDREAGERE